MDLPTGRCVHCIPGRLRLKIVDKRLDTEYLKGLEQALKKRFPQAEITTNVRTGSVLIQDRACDPESLAEAAKEQGLFELTSLGKPVPLALKIQDFFQGSSQLIRKSTRGELDLPSLIFLFLLGSAVYQIARGNLGMPPWYTAFWYAFGVFTKSVLDSDRII